MSDTKAPTTPGSDHSDGEPPEGNVNANRGSDPRRSGRDRKPSLGSLDALANSMAYEDFMAAAAAAARRTKQPSPATAPSTTTPAIAAPSRPAQPPVVTSSGLSSSSSHDNPLGGITAAMSGLRVGNPHAAAHSSSSSRDQPAHHSRRHHRRHRSRSRSVSPSSSSSDDEYTRGKHSIYYVGRRIKPKDQLHLAMIARMRAMYRSFKDWHDDNKCSNVRNQFEMEILSAVMDQLLVIDGYLDPRAPDGARNALVIAQELLCRRIHGVVSADETGSWSTATAVNLLHRRSLANEHIQRSINRDITATKAAKAATTNVHDKVSQTATNSRNNHRGRGGKGNKPTNPSSSSVTAPGGAQS